MSECTALQIQIGPAKRRPSRNWFGGRRRSCFVLCFGRAYRILCPTPNNGLPLIGGRIVTARIREQIFDTLLARFQRLKTFVLGAVVIVGRGSLSMALQPAIDRLGGDAPIF